MRAVRAFDPLSDDYLIAPFWYKQLPPLAAKMLLGYGQALVHAVKWWELATSAPRALHGRLDDASLLKRMSTSPNVEPPDFCDCMRAVITWLIEHPSPAAVFGDGRPLRVPRCGAATK